MSDRDINALSERAEEHWDKIADRVEKRWDWCCDYIEENGGDAGKWISTNFLRRLSVEAPVVVSFCFACVLIHILNVTIMPGLNRFLAVQDVFSITSPMQIPRLLTHVFAHDSQINHIKGNMVNLLLVGPSAEHVYGSKSMLVIFFLVAIVSAFAHIFIGSSHTHQLGASGIVFSVILLNSLVAADTGKIPVSFVLTAGLWVTDEIIGLVWNTDHMSHHAHLTGAIVGTIAGYYYKGKEALQALHQSKQRSSAKALTATSFWKKFTKAKTK